jgi:tetratricopeptide (TPR) repeat protein
MSVKPLSFLAFLQIAEDMANSEDRPDPPSDAKPPEEVNPAPLSRLRILARIAILAGLFLAALAGSWLLHTSLFDDEEPENTSAELPLKKIESAGNPTEILERGDQALTLHRFARAHAHYDELLERQPDSSPLVAYRIGLCNEALGQLDKAQAAYRKTIGAAPTPALTFAAHLGTARCLLRDHHPVDARRLLSPFLLDETRQQNVPAPMIATMRYLIALAFAEETLHPATPRITDDGFDSVNIVSLEIPFFLDEIGTPAKSRDERKAAPALSLQKQTNALQTVVLSAEQNEQPAFNLLDRLAKDAGLRTEWTPEAKQQLEDRNLRLALRNWPLVELLEQAADRYDLVCWFDAETIHFSTSAQTDAKLRSLAQRSATRRAMYAALKIDANHPWAPAALLELGIAEANDGNSTKAMIWFDRLLRNAPASAQTASACFNLALLHARKQERLLARQAWFRVIDHLPGHELALRSYLHIAQSHLEEEDGKEAIIQLRRAQKLAPGSPHQPVAAMLLAAAHLQQDQPDDARQVLNKHRSQLLAETHKPMAIFLNAYADYRLAKPANGGRREASELLNSIWHGMDDNPLGPIGDGLIAHAYLDLGFGQQAEQRLRQSLKTAQGPNVASLEYLLGETLLIQDRRADAFAVFAKLAASKSSYQIKADFRLTQMDLQDGRFTMCEEKCRRLWTQEAFTDKAALLRLWGAALDGIGEHARAARCFAGKAPD